MQGIDQNRTLYHSLKKVLTISFLFLLLGLQYGRVFSYLHCTLVSASAKALDCGCDEKLTGDNTADQHDPAAVPAVLKLAAEEIAPAGLVLCYPTGISIRTSDPQIYNCLLSEGNCPGIDYPPAC